jgi:hypothetical protein
MADHPSYTYFGTTTPVRVGDRIIVRRLLGRARLATVIYVPGQSPLHADLGAQEWAYRLDNGDTFVTGYFPAQIPHARKHIEFVSHPGEPASVDFPAESAESSVGQPGRDFLALIGCATLRVVLGLGAYALWLKWFGAS